MWVRLSDVDPAWLITVGVALSCFSGNWRYMGLPSSLDRAIIIIGLALTMRREWRLNRLARVVVRPVHIVLLGLLLYAICSAVWSETYRASGALFALLDDFGIIPFAIFALGPTIFAGERQRGIALKVFVALGLYFGLTAIFEGIGAKGLVFPHYISNPSVGITPGRSRGPFVAPDADGMAMFACGVFAVVSLSVWRGRWARAFSVATIFTCVAGIVFTVTRQVWLGCAVAAILVILATPGLRRWLLPTVALGFVVVVAMLAVVPGFRDQVQSRVDDNSSLWDRYNSNAAALRMIGARPVLGFGWYRFNDVSTPYLRLGPDYPLSTVNRPHNVFLSDAAELGVFPTAVLVLTLLYCTLRGFLARQDPRLRWWAVGMVAVLVNWIVVANFTPLGYPFNNYMVWLWLGIAARGWVPQRASAAPVSRTLAPVPA